MRKVDSFEVAFEDALHVGAGPEETAEIGVVSCLAEELHDGGEAGLLRKLDYLALCKTLDQLPEDRRRLLVLRYWEGKDWQEVADALGIPEPTARYRWRTLLPELARALLGGDVQQTGPRRRIDTSRPKR
jgi:DNA-directed RNA polymerase specialized sigma24 family protein